MKNYMFSFPSISFVNSLIILLLVSLSGVSAWAQAPGWQMALAANGLVNSTSSVQDMTTDTSGNVYLTGSFTGTIRLGSNVLTSAGSTDIFVAKWNPVSQTFLWVQQAGGIGDEVPYGVALDGPNIYVTGTFGSPTCSIGTTVLTNSSVSATADIFVAKLIESGGNGRFTWAQQAGGLGNDVAYGLAVSGANLYITGPFGSPTASFGTMFLTNVGARDTYVAKLVDNGLTGSFTWVQQAGGSDDDVTNAVAVQGNDVYVVGSFRSAAVAFGTTTVVNASSGTADMFVAKLTDAGTSGSFTWATRGGGVTDEYCVSVAVNGSNVYVLGGFNGIGVSFGTVSLTTNGATDVFIAKLTDTGNQGNFVWAQRGGGLGDEKPAVLAVRGPNLYVAGSFSGSRSNFGSSSLSATGVYDVFVARAVDAGSTGSFVWGRQAGGNGSDYAGAIALSNTNVYVGGNVAPPASFSSTLLNSPASSVAYLASLTDLALATALQTSAADFQTYPNPVHSAATVHLVLGAGTALTGQLLRLADATGRVVRVLAIPAGVTTLSLSLTGTLHPINGFTYEPINRQLTRNIS